MGLFGQEIAKEFSKTLFRDDFTSTNDVWTQTFNIDNLFIRQSNSFDLIRKNPETGYFVIPALEDKHSSYEVTAGFTLIEHTRKHSIAGILVMADRTKSSGILVEVSQKREYRVSRVYPDKVVPLTKGKDGWVKSSFAVTKGYNEIRVRTHGKVYDLYINQKFVTSFSEIELTNGSIGLYIGPGSRASFDFIEMLGEDVIKPVDPLVNPNATPEDLALTQVIIKMRNDMAKKDAEIEELKTQLKNCAGNAPTRPSPNTGIDTAMVNRNRELNAKVRELSTENDIIKAELLKSKAEAMRLQKFKDEVQSQQGGDIVINLTNLVSSQKDKIENLETRNKELQTESAQQKSDIQMLSNQIMKRDEKINLLENKNHELDSISRTYRGILVRFNIDPENPVAPVREDTTSQDSTTAEPDSIDSDYINELIEKERKRREEADKKKREEEAKIEEEEEE